MGWLDSLKTRIGGRDSTRPRAGDDELFDDEFQRKLEYLSVVSRRVFAGRLRAERRTKKTGSGVEFADHREYQPGDDIRYLDWNVFQRFDKLLLRLYEEEEDLVIYFVLDTSESMAFGSAKKLVYGKRICAALAYVALANLDRVEVVTTSDRVMGRMPETRGKARIFKIFRFLREASSAGTTNLEDAMRAFVAQHKRRGIVVLVSDLYDPAGFERGINVLRYAKFEPYVVHVADTEESRPKLQGDVLVYDCETGEEREVTVTSGVLAKFREAWEEYVKQIEHFCNAKQVPYVRADVGVPFEDMVLRIFRRGGFVR